MNHFMQLLAKELTGKDEQLVKIAYNSLRRKVADALLFMLNKYRTNTEQPFTINISRENLASLAGTATESLIRTLGDFKNERLIDIQEGKVLILNEQKIAEMVN
jgi:CRP-like cAMP-binding protein